MSNLILSLMVEKDVKRHILLLQRLLGCSQGVRIEQLSVELNVSTRTIQNDVILLNKEFTNLTLILHEGYNLRISSCKVEEIEQLIYKMTLNTLSIRLIESVYKKRFLNLDDLSFSLFSSKSSIKVRIPKINVVLSDYNVKIINRNGTIEGTEACVRRFYHAFFRELHEMSNFRYLSEDGEVERSDEMDISSVYPTWNKSTYSYHHCKLWLVIARDRIQSGFNIVLSKETITKVQNQESFQQFLKMYDRWMKIHCRVRWISLDEKIWMYLALKSAVIYKRNSLDNDEIDESMLFGLEKKMVVEVMDIVGCESHDQEEFIQLHLFLFSNLKQTFMICDTYQIMNENQKKVIRSEFCEIQQVWENTLRVNSKARKLEYLSRVADISYHFASITAQFNRIKNPGIQRILFSFTGESVIIPYIEGVARNYFETSTECHFVHHEPLSESLIQKVNPNIVVVNYSVPNLAEERKFQLPYLPTRNDWLNLVEFIYDFKHVALDNK